MPGCQVDLIRQQLCEELLRFHDGRRCDQPLTRAEFDALKLPALRGVVKDKDVAFDVACHLVSLGIFSWVNELDLIWYFFRF